VQKPKSRHFGLRYPAVIGLWGGFVTASLQPFETFWR
jgi:hypothetical protein